MRARNNEVGEMVKIANEALHCLAGDFDNFVSNQRLNANNKTRGPRLQAANVANLSKRVNLANNFQGEFEKCGNCKFASNQQVNEDVRWPIYAMHR